MTTLKSQVNSEQPAKLSGIKTFTAICLAWLVGTTCLSLYFIIHDAYSSLHTPLYSSLFWKLFDFLALSCVIGIFFVPVIFSFWLLFREFIKEGFISCTLFGGLMGIGFTALYPIGATLALLAAGFICGASYWKVSRYMLKPKQARISKPD